jgi:molybdopterin converting factor small subunit
MDVRVKLNALAQAKKVPQQQSEVLTGLPQSSVKSLLDILSLRHPELGPVFKEANESRDLRIYVNNDELPTADATRYILRDGDTVSLFVNPPTPPKPAK